MKRKSLLAVIPACILAYLLGLAIALHFTTEENGEGLRSDSAGELSSAVSGEGELSLNHSFGEWKITKPSCTLEGRKTRVCLHCGFVQTEVIPPTGHAWEILSAREADCTHSGLTEGKKCRICGEISIPQNQTEKTPHRFSEWEIVRQPDCGRNGFRRRICSICGSQEKETIPASGNHRYFQGKCTVCGAEEKAAEGLCFMLTEDGTGYICTGSSKRVLQGRLEIPERYQGLPVVEIGESAFRVTLIESVCLPPQLRRIGSKAFLGCSKLKKVTVPDSVRQIGMSAFYGCTQLEHVSVSGKSWKENGTAEICFADSAVTAKILRESHYSYEKA